MESDHMPIKAKDAECFAVKEKSLYNDVTNMESLRKIINETSSKNNVVDRNDLKEWKQILCDLLHFLCMNEEIGNETVLLASHAYLSLRRALFTPTEFENTIKEYLNLQTQQTIEFHKVHLVYNVDLFKLIICNGFLQIGNNVNCSHEIYTLIFRIIYLDCIRYTRLTYFAFKILQLWMQRTSKTDFWSKNPINLEEKLEAVIFSNWENAICRASVIGLFSLYLNVMKKKYTNFVTYLFYNCVERISWCHATKYLILAEICAALDNIHLMTEPKFISNLFNSLTFNHLSSASTKVYSNICNKLSKDSWKITFGEQLKNYVITWEAEKQYSTLQTLCKRWIEPVIRTHRDILSYLSECCDEGSVLYQSHLLRIAKKYNISLLSLKKPIASPIFLEHEEELIRLNAFAAHCYELGYGENQSSVSAVKHFLYFNATTDTKYLREGVFNYFKVFLSNLLKRVSVQKNSQEIVAFLDWLHEFLMDCFEIGSCYQRKIFGLHLLKISLQFLMVNNCTDTILTKDPNFKEAMRYGPQLQVEMKESGKWKLTSKESIVMLFKLVLDPANDIKEIAASIIIDFFDTEILTETEKVSIFKTALDKCNSCKFFETDSGACLFKILTLWFPLNEVNKISLKMEKNSIEKFESYIRFLFEEAKIQLVLVKEDILKAVTQNTPFYGIVIALQVTGFSNGPESQLITTIFLEEIMNFTEDAINYFLSAFSSKSSSLEYSSSFEEMGLAINQAIKSSEVNYEFDELVLSPAQQSIITCIWRSLKILCELVVEVAKSEHASDEIIRRASDLIVMVSLKCRHKGVIESAGVSIGNLTRYLCKSPKRMELIKGHLKKLLVNDFSTSINLTRRGAGLTIMFHRIIANDVRDERPLLHLAVNTLVYSLRESASIRVEQRETSYYDDPCTMQLNYLRTLVADKQLQSQLIPYLEHICLTCFEYMTSQVFTIRNASYQLFGAIVSRLVGQNTGAKLVDFGYGHSINYFATHFPQLAAHVLLNLQACCHVLEGEDKWQNSMNIIHVLSLLSKMFFSGCELIDGTAMTYVRQIRSCLQFFLKSPMAHVRHLAAKSYVATVGLSSIEREIGELKAQISAMSNFNHLNGYLCTLEYLYEKQADEIQSTTFKHSKMKSLSEVRKNLEIRSKFEKLWNFWARRSTLIKKKELCYAIEAQLLRLSRNFKLMIEENYSVESKKKNNFDTLFEKTKPGFFEFVDELMGLFASHISYNGNEEMVKYMLGVKCMDFGIYFLKHSPRNNRSLLMTVIDNAINYFELTHPFLLEEINMFANESIRNIFRGKMLEFQYNDISKLKIFASRLENSFARTIQLSELLTSIHVLSLRGSGTHDIFEELISCVSKEEITFKNYFKYPEICRELICKGLEILLHNFDHLNSGCRKTPLLASLILMKDEVFSIRKTIRDSVLNNVILQFELSDGRVMDEIIYIILLVNVVSEKSVLGELKNAEVIDFFTKYLATIENQFNTFNAGNPFDDNNITPYKEESKLINFIVFFMQQKISDGDFVKSNGMYKNIDYKIFETNRNIMQKMNINPINLQDILHIEYNEYLTEKLKVVNEVYLKNK